ncbi:ABC transporter, ATP-binding protein [Clostridioides difficile 050-P50-2011]|nr:ABC transporter, ATP-binding protein [Clostridioides difficile 050-P50-2011]EHJ32191.1 ABC transporter, ATP-binding protein [Clostridioides difficile 002-P50-2011]
MNNLGGKCMKLLKVIDIKKIYGKGENEIKAVDGITLEIEPHKFSAIIGQSGSGKSTLLHCMAGLDKPTLGDVFMDNLDLYTLSDDKLSNLRSKEFGFIFQNYNLIPVINVYDNIVLPILIAKGKIDNNYINDLITKLGLESQINKFPNELSGGQQQRVAIARSLANKPSIIFADEPTGNLDSKTTDEVMNLLKYCVNEYKQTLVMITHNDEIAKMADCIITISDGKVI